MEKDFLRELYAAHQEVRKVPSPAIVCKVIDGLLQLMFPELADRTYKHFRDFEYHYQGVRVKLFTILDTFRDVMQKKPEEVEKAFMEQLPNIRNMLLLDVEAICAGDPAAHSNMEVIRTYPGFFAIAIYRIAHELLRQGVPMIPRILTEHAHKDTGIDIHPAARIGERFCIDHGTGIVIGETVEIGKHVKIYQGVTLGALSVAKELAKTKRHPTIEDNVVIYSGATILGGETVIGHDSIIGGNVWLTKSVPPHSVLYYKAAIRHERKDDEFPAEGMSS